MLPVLQFVCLFSAPCVPQNLLPITDCSSDSITLTWNMANGALFYAASVADSSGGIYTCSTADLNCKITGLRCGTTYNASMISSNYKCNSSVSTRITVETGSWWSVPTCSALSDMDIHQYPGDRTTHSMQITMPWNKKKSFSIAQVLSAWCYGGNSVSLFSFVLSFSQPLVPRFRCRPL